MRRGVGGVAAAILAVASCHCDPALAQGGLGMEPWRLEAVELSDGVRLEGLIDEVGQNVIFVDVVKRPPGRPMYIVSWGPISRERIRKLETLPAADHERLAARVEDFLAGREAAAAGAKPAGLRRDGESGPWRYEAAAFTFESTADAASSRDAIVRLEEVFGAFEVLVPPTVRAADAARPHVRICGTAAEYRELQRLLGVQLENPALYAAGRRLLASSSDLPGVAARQGAAAEANAAAMRRLKELDRELADRLKALIADLERERVLPAAREQLVQQVRARWKKEREAESLRIEAANRVNVGRLTAVRREFYGRLAHEAWHAYADTRLRAGGEGRLPSWLDEGLAQVLEGAPIDAGEIRLGDPDPRRLAAVQHGLRDGSLPAVSDVIRAGPEQFLAGHAQAAARSERMYLVSWALALDLAIVAPVLSPTAVTALCAEPPGGDPVRQFETLVGMPVAAFEPAWRRRILDLRPRTPPLRQVIPAP
ncbi:MAG: hypothetical protein ACK6CT_08045 [Planctomycetia bacterium]